MADSSAEEIIKSTGLMPQAFPITDMGTITSTTISDDIVVVSDNFKFTFENAGYMRNGVVYTAKVS